jgi:TonB family protein
LRIDIAVVAAALAFIAPAALATPDTAPASALAYYPKDALAAGVSGTAKVLCHRRTDGTLFGCTLTSESPAGAGFGAAALAIAEHAVPTTNPKVPPEVGLYDARELFTFQASPPAVLPDLIHRPRGGPVDTHAPNWEQVSAYYPRAAAQLRINGRAIVNCVIDAEGALDDCRVLKEEPVGHGFGDAAIGVAHAYHFASFTTGGDPSQGLEVNIPMVFDAPATKDLLGAPPTDPVLAYYPKPALAAGADGEATLNCARNAHLALRDCTLSSESPPGQGFGAAALAMAAKSPDNPKLNIDEPTLTAAKPITVRFSAHPPAIDPDLTQMAHVMKAPQVASRPSAEVLHLYYPERAYRAGIAGGAQIHCQVTRGGRLTGCATVREAPQGQDFGAAARLVAQREYRMTPMLYDGEPSDGGETDLAIEFGPN